MEQHDDNLEVSQLKVQFGDENHFGPSNIHSHFLARINKKSANEQRAELFQEFGDQLDLDFSVVFKFHAQNRQELKQAFDHIYEESFPESDKQFFSIVREFKEQGIFAYKSALGASHDVVGISLSITEENRMMQQQFQEFVESGMFTEIQDHQNNYIQIHADLFSTFEHMLLTMMDGKVGLGTAMLDNALLLIRVALDKKLSESLKEIISQFDPSFLSHPFFIAFQFFRSLDLEINFDSPDTLPDVAKRYFQTPLSFFKGHQPSIQLPELLKSVLQNMDSEFGVFFNLTDFAAISLKLKGQQFSDFLLEKMKFLTL